MADPSPHQFRTFRHLQKNLKEALLGCGSGRELIAKGFEDDVTHAAQLNRYDTVPVMRGEKLVRYE